MPIGEPGAAAGPCVTSTQTGRPVGLKLYQEPLRVENGKIQALVTSETEAAEAVNACRTKLASIRVAKDCAPLLDAAAWRVPTELRTQYVCAPPGGSASVVSVTGCAQSPTTAPASGAAASLHSDGLCTGHTTTSVAEASWLSAGPERVSSNSAGGALADAVVFETLTDAVDESEELVNVTVGSVPAKATERLPALTEPVAVTRALHAAIADEPLASTDITKTEASDSDRIGMARRCDFM